MRLKNMVRIPPVPLSDTIGMAEWLESMALQGMYYEGLFYSRHFIRSILFKEGPPARVRYRIDPSPGTIYGDPPPGLKDLYEDEGWDYVDSPGRCCHLFMSRDTEAVEPYDTPQSLGQAMEPQLSMRKKNLLLGAALFTLNIFLLMFLLSSRNRASGYRLTLLILLGIGLAFSAWSLRQIIRQKQQLDQGHPTPCPTKHHKLYLIGLIVIGVFYALVDIYVLFL